MQSPFYYNQAEKTSGIRGLVLRLVMKFEKLMDTKKALIQFGLTRRHLWHR
jgi:hypothetical protein